jgi:hypothetical protein
MADFGSGYVVRGVARDLQGQIYARLQYQGRSFDIHLMQDGKTWRYN